MNTVDLKINGMTCGSCVASVTRALQRVPGVSAVDVDLAQRTARVSVDPANTPALLAELHAAGYEASPVGGRSGDEPDSRSSHGHGQGGCGSAPGPKSSGCCCR